MTCNQLISTYDDGWSGTGHCQFLEVEFIDSETGEIIFRSMRAEAFLKLVNPDLVVDSFHIKAQPGCRIRSGEHPRTKVLITIYANIYDVVPNYYSDEEWKEITSTYTR